MPYPEQQVVLNKLVLDGHRKLKDEPLLVAIYYASELVEKNEERLFEVMQNFGFNDISEDKEIFQIQFSAASGLPLPPDRVLRLLLTNPVELEQAVDNQWEQIIDLKAAISRKEFKVLYENSNSIDAKNILKALFCSEIKQ